MKTETHQIDGASMERIEELASAIDYRVPDWVPHIVAIEGTQTSVLDEMEVNTQHYSGYLRELSMTVDTSDAMRRNRLEVTEALDQSAERLDQAHQDWLEADASKLRLNGEERDTLRLAIEGYCESLDSSEETGDLLDAIWNKIQGATT